MARLTSTDDGGGASRGGARLARLTAGGHETRDDEKAGAPRRTLWRESATCVCGRNAKIKEVVRRAAPAARPRARSRAKKARARDLLAGDLTCTHTHRAALCEMREPLARASKKVCKLRRHKHHYPFWAFWRYSVTRWLWSNSSLSNVRWTRYETYENHPKLRPRAKGGCHGVGTAM